MKKFITAVLCLIAFSGLAQEEMETEVSVAPIEMEFNKQLYPLNEFKNMFMSVDHEATILAFVVPAPYDMLKAGVIGQEDASASKSIIESGEFKEAGKTIAYQIAADKNEDGKDLIMETYLIKLDGESSIMVTGTYEPVAKIIFQHETKKAALSAKVGK
ncbi:MAG TPA: hypothetical protein VFR70_02930 [Flavobacterium sp.]|nr:hypothetical protein [Flavobacterium sp.]